MTGRTKSAASGIQAAIAQITTHIEGVRSEIAEIDSRLGELAEAAPDRPEIERRATITVAAMAGEAKRRMATSALAACDFDVNRVVERLVGGTPIPDAGFLETDVTTPSTPPMLVAALLLPTEVKKLLVEDAVAALKDAGSVQMGAADVEREREALEDRRLILGAKEEIAIRHAEASGISIPRRPDADPALLVGTDDGLEAAANG